MAATDVFGSVVGTAAYYPFGEQRTGTGLFDTDRGFTGQIFDGGTGLGFYNARYQDPVLGRFISPDSIVPNPFSAADYNRYSYTQNNPLLFVDPSGHQVCSFVGEYDSCDETNVGSSVPLFRNEDINRANYRRELDAYRAQFPAFDSNGSVLPQPLPPIPDAFQVTTPTGGIVGGLLEGEPAGLDVSEVQEIFVSGLDRDVTVWVALPGGELDDFIRSINPSTKPRQAITIGLPGVDILTTSRFEPPTDGLFKHELTHVAQVDVFNDVFGEQLGPVAFHVAYQLMNALTTPFGNDNPFEWDRN